MIMAYKKQINSFNCLNVFFYHVLVKSNCTVLSNCLDKSNCKVGYKVPYIRILEYKPPLCSNWISVKYKYK